MKLRVNPFITPVTYVNHMMVKRPLFTHLLLAQPTQDTGYFHKVHVDSYITGRTYVLNKNTEYNVSELTLDTQPLAETLTGIPG